MKFTHLLAAFFLLFTLRLTAQSSCPLPAPTNLTNVTNNQTYVKYTFNPVSGATGYRVKITYPSGAPTQTLDINNPNADTCGITVLPETRTFSIYSKCGNSVSPNGVFHTTSVNIITVDLVSGYEIKRTETVDVCLTTNPLGAAVCNLISPTPDPNTIDHILSFKHGVETVTMGLKMEGSGNGNDTQLTFYYKPNEGWNYTNFSNKKIRILKPTTYYQVGMDVYADNSWIYFNPIPGAAQYISDIKIVKIVAPEYSNQVSSTNEGLSTNTVIVSPNPFNDNLTLTMEAPETGNVSVQLYNLTGGLQKSLEITPAELTNNTYTIPTADLATGMYIMQVSTEQGVRHTSKVFKL